MAYFCLYIMKKFKFRKIHRLKAKKSFQLVYKKGRTVVDGFAVFYILKGQDENFKIGLAAGKKLGCAVVRNRTKRMMREVFRHHQADLKLGYHTVWVARNRLVGADYETYDRAFMRLAKKADLLR